MNTKETMRERLLEYSNASVKTIFQKLNINDNGLTKEQVSEQRKKYGSNIPDINNKRHTIFYCIKKSFVNPFSMILFFLGVISFFTDVFLPNKYQRDITNVFIIFIMLIVSGIVRLTQELHSKRITDNLLQIVHTTVNVLRDGEWKEISSYDLVVGDRVKVSAGDRVPADIRLINDVDLFVSQSQLTGESAVFEKTSKDLKAKPKEIADYKNVLFCGTTITGGTGEGVVFAVGQDTACGILRPLVMNKCNGFDKGANSIAMVFFKFMVVLIPIVFLAGGLTKGNWLDAFLFATSVSIGLTPELLPMVVTACLAKGSFSMGQKQTVVKNINAMQAFGCMDILCVDKTGTLTGDTVHLEYYMDILGNESKKVLDYAYLSSHYHTGVKNQLEDSICKVKNMPGMEAYYKNLPDLYPELDEMPFDYERKFTSVIVKNNTKNNTDNDLQNDTKNICIIKGSIDNVVSRCRFVEYHGEVKPVGDDIYNSVHSIVDEMLEDGMKMIAVAYKMTKKDKIEMKNENDFILLGYLTFFDAPKKSVPDALQKLHELNVKCKVLSGDHKKVVLSICRRLGMNTQYCITGEELDMISENELPVVLEKTNIFAELSPRQKALIVENLQINGHFVGFLGDGLNDLPAMTQADVGISVENAADAAKETANVILLKKDLDVLEEGILEGRKVFLNMSKYIKITASSNFGNICSIVIASILLPFFPMTSVQILMLNLLYDFICLIIPWDNVDMEMISKPLDWSERKLSRFMIFFGSISSIFDLLTYLFLYFVLCPFICGGMYYSLAPEGQQLFISLFQTGWFLESMWTQLLILQLLRTKQIPFIQSRSSKQVICVTILGICMYSLIPYTIFGKFLDLTQMPWLYFIYLIVCVIGYLLFVSLAKVIYIRKNRKLI